MPTNKIFGEKYLQELESQVDKLIEQSNQDLQKIDQRLQKQISEFDRRNDQIQASLNRVSGLNSVSDKAVDRLLEQVQDEVRLDNQSAKLKAEMDQKLNDRINRLQNNSPIRGETPKKPVTDQELADRLKKLKENSPIRPAVPKRPITSHEPADNTKKPRIDGTASLKPSIIVDDNEPRKTSLKKVSFNETISIIPTNLDAQASIASAFAEKSTNIQEANSLNRTANSLKQMGNIIDDIPQIPKKHENAVATIITKGLKAIYEGIKTVGSSALSAIKDLGSSLINSIKSSLSESPEKQLETSRKNIKGLYNALVDLKGITGKGREQFLQKHYAEVDQLQTPKDLFLETAKVTKAIQNVGAQKIHDLRQQRKGNLRPERHQDNSLGNMPTPQTPNAKPTNTHSKGPSK